MKKRFILALSVLVVIAACKPKKPTAQAPKPDPATAKAKPSVSSKIKGLKKYPGLFDVYQDTSNGSAYLLIRKDQLNQEFIYFTYTENGVVQAGHNRGSYRDNDIFSIRKSYDNIEFIKENTNFYFDSNSALYKSKEANISPALLISEDIVAMERDSVYLISADKIFLTEALARVKPVMPPIPGLSSFMFNLGSLNPKKTRYQKIRSYPENTDFLVEYVFDNPGAYIQGGAEITDPRSVSILFQHSFIRVPQNNFQPRKDDPRVGYFMQQSNDMTSYSATPYRDVINRWHLVKKDPDLVLSEPVEPITWWIENTTPVEYRETIRQAALTWNQAFEKAGFKNAIKVEIQPDTATWDAGDIRYNVLRWTSSPNPPFGGYGPSFVNPRTGQILGADIMLEFVFLTNRLNQYDLFTTSGLSMVTEGEEESVPHVHNGHECHAGDLMHHNTMLGMAHLNAMDADPKQKEEFIRSAIYYLILHEMGHTLGLMHNMKASNLWMPADIHNKTLTQSKGLIGSVMDYPAININPDHSKQGDFYTTKPGPYDLWAIEYGYSEAISDPVAEEARLNKILSRSTEADLTFGNDADDMRSPGKGTDPRVMIFDISGDAIAYSSSRIEMLNTVMPKLKDKYAQTGEGFQALVNSYLTITGEIGNASGVISRYIGGVYVERSVVGQNGAQVPYRAVPAGDQKRAMKSLERLIFAPDAFKAADGLYQYLQAQRRGFNFFARTEDPKILDRVLNIQKGVLNHVLHQNTMERISNSTLYGNTYSAVDVVNDLEKAIFDADLSGNVNNFRVSLQTYHVQKLIAIAGLKEKSGYDDVARAAAFNSLLSIQKKLKANESKGDSTSQAHRKFLGFLIAQAMEK